MRSIREWTVSRYRRTKDFCRRQAPYLILVLFLLGFAAIFFWGRMVIPIRPGELGVLWRYLGGGTQLDTVYREGVHVILPFNKMYIYNVRKQQFTETIQVLTVNGLMITVRYSVRYYLDKDTLPLLQQRVGPDYLTVVVLPEVRSVIRMVLGQCTPEEIYATQKAIQERVSVLSKRHLEARFIALDDVPIESVKLPAKITEAIEAKMTQQQVEETYVYRLSIAAKEAERRRIESAGIKVYNDTVNSSLNPSVLTWHGLRVTEEFAKSPNTKTVVIGAGKNGLPLILGQ